MLSRLNTLVANVTDNLDKFELGLAAQKVQDFIWDVYCDWYIEIAKLRLNSAKMKPRPTAPARCLSAC